MLEDPRDPKVAGEVVAFLNALATTKGKRAELVALTQQLAAHPEQSAPGKSLSTAAQALVRDAGKDLAALLGDLPDASLAGDWSYLCREMAHDLLFGAPAALAKLEAVRALRSSTRRARGSSRPARQRRNTRSPAISSSWSRRSRRRPIRSRRRRRSTGFAIASPRASRPRSRRSSSASTHPRLRAACSRTSHLRRSTPTTTTTAVLDYLASNLYSGHGAHSMFMKTWAAGLAYSNGLHPNVELGRSARVLRRALPAAAADAQVRHRSAARRQAGREHRALRDRRCVHVARRRWLRAPRGRDGREPRRRPAAGHGPRLPHARARAEPARGSRARAVQADAGGLRQGAPGLRRGPIRRTSTS